MKQKLPRPPVTVAIPPSCWMAPCSALRGNFTTRTPPSMVGGSAGPATPLKRRLETSKSPGPYGAGGGGFAVTQSPFALRLREPGEMLAAAVRADAYAKLLYVPTV